MLPDKRSSVLAVLTSVLVLAACSGSDVTRPPDGPATLVVTANLAATSAVTVVVEVTAPDITTPLVFNLAVNQTTGVASGTVTLPAGSNRTITLRAFDAGGIQTHQGVAGPMNIAAGTNPAIALVLTPLTGDLPINATIGSLTVTVTPSPANVGVGLTVTLTATITVSGGGAVPAGTVSWATSKPGVASVTSTGVVTGGTSTGDVTGVGAGQTSIVATFLGVAGAATVNVP